jgi:hypothetical protein
MTTFFRYFESNFGRHHKEAGYFQRWARRDGVARKSQYWRNIVNAVAPDLNKVSRLPLAADDPDSGDDIDAALWKPVNTSGLIDGGKILNPSILGMVPKV